MPSYSKINDTLQGVCNTSVIENHVIRKDIISIVLSLCKIAFVKRAVLVSIKNIHKSKTITAEFIKKIKLELG